MHVGICSSNPNNAMAQLATGMLCVAYTELVTPFSIERQYLTPWYMATKLTPQELLHTKDLLPREGNYLVFFNLSTWFSCIKKIGQSCVCFNMLEF